MPDEFHSLGRRHGRYFLLINLLLILAAMLLVGGLIWPIMTVEKLFFWENEVSIASGLTTLWEQSEYMLFAVILMFSVCFPALKIIVLLVIWNRAYGEVTKMEAQLGFMHRYAKWSMLDVFVVAMLVASVKLGALAQVEVHQGLYAFAGSVLLSMVLTGWIDWLARR